MISNKLFEKYGVKREELWKLSSAERLEFRFRYKDIEEETKVDNSLFKDVMFLLAVGLVVLLFNIIGIVLFGLLTSGIIHIFNSEWVYKQIDGIVNKPELYLPIIKIFLLGLCVGSTVLVISIIIISIILISICFVKWIKNNWKQANEIVDNKENFK